MTHDKFLITVFTPTYNRAYMLPNLYMSLLKQKERIFEWVVVNDGSEDNTDDLLKKWKSENRIMINYIKTTNGGKHRAVNRGVKEANGELFFIVDSDDYLSTDAIETIQMNWENLYLKTELSGICYRKIIYTTGKYTGPDFPEPMIMASSLDMVYRYNAIGDKAEIFRTEILRQYPFPEIKGENFIPEAYIWNRITSDRPMCFINNGIYFCEYLQDGLTVNYIKNLKQNPKGFMLYYKDAICYKNVPLKVRIIAAIRIIQCCFFLFAKRKT